jgi:pyruvate,water dikinase
MPRWENESLPGYLDIIEQWKNVDLAELSDDELLQGIRKLAHEDAVYWFAAAVPLGLARISDTALDLFLKSALKGSQLTSGSFLRGFPSKTAEAQARLEVIARQICTSDELRERVIHTPASSLLEVLTEHPDAMAAFQQYLDVYGHQIYNLDFAAPTLADDPMPVLLNLKAAVAHPELDVRAQQARLAQERDMLAARAEQALTPFLRPLFRLLLGWAQRYSPNREIALFYVGAAWPALRKLALELGQRLTEAGSLINPNDVFFLKTAELLDASAERTKGGSQPDLGELARERRILQAARKRLTPPVSVPPDGQMKFGPIDMAWFEPKPRTVSSGPILDGFAVSPGQVTGPAIVIRSLEDFYKMRPDSILVCISTTPAWTPLFAQAKGLVTDIGGALAHGSIVAREYGIPAVMGTGVATQRIRSEQLIRVDGNRGTVTLVDEIDEQEIERIQARQLAEKRAVARKRKVISVLVAGSFVVFTIWWKKHRKKARSL